MKLAIITDTHHGVKNDVLYMLDYQEKFYKEVFFPTLLKEGVKQVIHGGDFFDRRKYINFNTLYRTKRMFLEPMLEYEIMMDIIPGNHDVYAKNTNEINSLQELLKEYSNITQIHSPTTKTYGDKSFMFIPWINNENYADTMTYISKNDADILVGHLELAGFDMYAGQKNEHGMDMNVFSKFKQVWSGHFHHKSQKDNIYYLGAPMEFTFSDCDDPRGFHIYDTETGVLTFYQNPFKMYQKFYYDDSSSTKQSLIRNIDVTQFSGKILRVVVNKKTNPILFEMFIESLYNQSLVDLTIIQDISEFATTEEELLEIRDKSTKELMSDYITTIETDMDKSKLKSLLFSVYNEALNNSHTNG